MKIHRLSGSPDRKLALALAEFEKEFTYPLGPGLSFSICHGADYSLFFRGMGEARIYLAEISGNIVGALAVVQRTAVLADGTVIPAVYLCDAKVAAAHRGRTVLGRLAIKARDETMAQGYQAAYSVVMSGSLPADTYTGRLGIPHFMPLGQLVVLRFDTRTGFRPVADFLSLEFGNHHRFISGNAALSSEMQALTLDIGEARGVLVDTRLGKRLMESSGHEIISAHLTGLVFESARGLSNLIVAAVEAAGKMGFLGVFVSLPADHPALGPIIESAIVTPTVAHATVFGTGLPEGRYLLNPSEI